MIFRTPRRRSIPARARSAKGMKEKRSDLFTRLAKAEQPLLEDDKPSFEASLFDLITAFGKVLKEVPRSAFHEVIKDEFSVSDKIHDILHMLIAKKAIFFKELFKNAKNRSEVVTIFLALLEMVKLREVVVKQTDPFGDIEIVRNVEWQKE